jgi:hypothetical protein
MRPRKGYPLDVIGSLIKAKKKWNFQYSHL